MAELNQSEELLEQTLVAGSPDRGKEHDYEDDFTGSLDSEEKTQNESGKVVCINFVRVLDNPQNKMDRFTNHFFQCFL